MTKFNFQEMSDELCDRIRNEEASLTELGCNDVIVHKHLSWEPVFIRMKTGYVQKFRICANGRPLITYRWEERFRQSEGLEKLIRKIKSAAKIAA